MTRCIRYVLSMLSVVIGCAIVSVLAAAQDSARPVTQVAANHTIADAVLGRKIALQLDRVRLDRALEAIESQSGVRIIYSAAEVPVAATVSLSAKAITVGDALDMLLAGTGLRIVVPSTMVVRLEPNDKSVTTDLPQQRSASIAGHVTDGALHTALSEVSVRIDIPAPIIVATTTADGKYIIPSIAPGVYTVTARRVGYQSLTKDVTLSANETATLNFALTAAPTRLDEVVTTAVGDQRRYAVGNDIATINVDSLAPTTPVNSLTDVISGRAPGVEVVESGGLAGEGEAIRIRGQSSLVLQGDPIVIVDGVRQDNSPGGSTPYVVGLNRATPSPTRLNDLDVSQIETIEVLKGPSASTEYGTDAANGVIVITTKHGASGAPQWHASAEQSYSDMPVHFPQYYYSRGHTTDGTAQAVNCPVSSGYLSGVWSTAGTCVVDSVTHFNPLDDAATSIYGTGAREKYDLSVSGGSDAVRYYVSGGLSNEGGLAHLPDAFRPEAQGLGFPASVDNANSEDQRSVRANTFIRLAPNADLSVNAAYLATQDLIPSSGTFANGPDARSAQPGPPDSANGFGYGIGGNNPLASLGEPQTQNTDRLTAGMTANWHLAPWLLARATAGVDHGSQLLQVLDLPQALLYANPRDISQFGYISLGNSTTDIYSTDLRATATAALTRSIGSVTSVGLQVVDTRTQGQAATAYGGNETNLTLDGALNPEVKQTGDRSATLGGYVEEQVGVADRLFLTGALRVDAASGFGADYHSAAYPKAGISWLAIQRGATTLRLRAAYGQSGVQPANGAALALYNTTVVLGANGAAAGGASLGSPGNPYLEPERSEEYEGGFDLGLWGNRLSVEATAYQKTTHDALYNLPLGWDLNDVTYQENIGEVQNSGFEGSISAVVIQSSAFAWNLTLSGSINHNTLVRLAPGAVTSDVLGNIERQEVGYPLYGYWGNKVTYADLNHDGVLDANEVMVADSASYAGSSLPTQEASLASHLAFWRGALSVAALFDYKGGFRVYNSAAGTPTAYGGNDPEAPLWMQARYLAEFTDGAGTPSGYLEPGDFVRFRELSLTYALPSPWARRIRTQNIALTAAVRNLALWTRYTGGDPEVTSAVGLSTQINGTPYINNDIRDGGASAVPIARYVVLRLNVGI